MASIDLNAFKALTNWHEAAAALALQACTEDDLQKIISLVNEVLCRYPAISLMPAPRVLASRMHHTVILEIGVDTSPREASALTLAMVDKLIFAGLTDSPVLASFMGTSYKI